MIKRKYQWLIGIDEAGRGPIAGPVSVGVVAIHASHGALLNVFPKILDSKQVTPKKREEFFEILKSFPKDFFRFHQSFGTTQMIDSQGIVPTIQHAMAQSLKKIGVDPDEVLVLLDGALKAPEEYISQQTIIGGDAKEQCIGLASIIAKVCRDRHMVSLSKKYPEYEFEKHKGYGTKKHYTLIEKCGLTDIHRKSFLRSRPDLFFLGK